MFFIDWIVDGLDAISEFFFSIGRWCDDQGWPFTYVADFFWSLGTTFFYLKWDFVDFGDWVDDVAAKILKFISWIDLDRWFREWSEKILEAYYWVRSAWSNVTDIVEEWWQAISITVQGWIDAAVQGLDDLIVAWNNFWSYTWPEWTARLTDLRSLWDDFWNNTFPTLVSFTWLETWWNTKLIFIDELIESILKEWFPFYNELRDLWDNIKEFITDPLQWFYDRLEELFDRFW